MPLFNKDKMLAIHTDGGFYIGMGHLMECINLARELKKLDINSIFILKATKESVSLIKNGGFNFKIVPPRLSSLETHYWINNFLDTIGIKVILINFPRARLQLIRFFQKKSKKVIAITENQKDSYADLVVNVIKEPQYMPINPIFSKFNTSRHQRKGISKILISMGATDSQGMIFDILKWTDEVKNPLDIVVIIGVAFKQENRLRKFADSYTKKISIFKNISCNDMLRNMDKTDIAITAGGDTMFELASRGVPSIAICPGPRQSQAASVFEQHNAVINLGIFKEISKINFLRALSLLLNDYKKINQISESARKLIDGRGTIRLARKIKRFIAEAA